MSDTVAPPVSAATRVRLHPLRMRADGNAWIIGRAETGDFITAPDTAYRAIGLLAKGHTIGQTRSALRAQTGTDIDIAGFVSSMIDLGFVRQIDGHILDGPPPPRPTLLWLRPSHVRWLLHPATAVSVGAIMLAGAVAVAVNPRLVPGYHDLLWSHSGAAVILGNVVLAWSLIGLHELAHLATARGAGVPGRMSLSTRLQFLAAQTDVSGIWAAPRRARLTVYSAGMTTDLTIASLCVLILGIAEPGGVTGRILAAAVLLALIAVPLQFLVFMRTDVYFIIQDLAGCANLYADGSAYARYLAKQTWRRLRGHQTTLDDPSRALPPRERRAARAYTAVLVAGTAVCLAIAVAVTLPVTVTLIADAVKALTGEASPVLKVDSLVVFAVIGFFQAMWFRAWWHRHGAQVRCLTRRRRRDHPYPTSHERR